MNCACAVNGCGDRLFDAHLHIIDPRFPLVPNRGYLPNTFTCKDYLDCIDGFGLNITGGAIVSGSFQKFDQSYLIDALSRLGPGFVGVTQLPTTTPDAEILRLQAAGVRAVRFNLYRGGAEQLADLEHFASRIYDLAGWHVELYVDSGELSNLEPRLAALPKVSIDHLGMTRKGYAALLRLVEGGMKVKATGFGRVRLNVTDSLREIADANPTALMFGTDLPGTRARRPFKAQDLDLIVNTLGETLAWRVLHHNAAEWYRPDKPERS